MSLVSLARARLHPEAAQVSDDLLTAALAVAEEKVLTLVGQTIGLAEHTDVLNVTSSFNVWLSQLPVTSITTVTATDQYTGEETDIDPADLSFDPNTGEVRYAAGSTDYFPLGWRNLEVVYNAGLAAVPEGVAEAIIVLALAMVETAGTSNMLHLGSEAADYATGLRAAANMDMPPLVLQLLHDRAVPGVTGT